MTQTEQMEVTDADREAYLAFNMLSPWDADNVRAGKWDHLTGMQVIARHRQSSIAPLVEEVERLRALVNEALTKQENDRTMWVPEWQIWAVEARAALSPLPAKEGEKATMTLNLSQREMAVIEKIAAETDMSKTAVMRQALRLYQLTRERICAGETMHFSGDRDRMVMFVGPDFIPENLP